LKVLQSSANIPFWWRNRTLLIVTIRVHHSWILKRSKLVCEKTEKIQNCVFAREFLNAKFAAPKSTFRDCTSLFNFFMEAQAYPNEWVDFTEGDAFPTSKFVLVY
jgi:hypothetical protein